MMWNIIYLVKEYIEFLWKDFLEELLIEKIGYKVKFIGCFIYVFYKCVDGMNVKRCL